MSRIEVLSNFNKGWEPGELLRTGVYRHTVRVGRTNKTRTLPASRIRGDLRGPLDLNLTFDEVLTLQEALWLYRRRSDTYKEGAALYQKVQKLLLEHEAGGRGE